MISEKLLQISIKNVIDNMKITFAMNISILEQFLFFSLGKKCADIYLSFKPNTSKVKSSHCIEMTYENKKKRAVGLAESIMNQCVILFNNLRAVVKVEKMCRLRDDFVFILRMLNSLGSQCDVMTSNIFRTSFAYWPLLIDMHKDETLNILYDMHKVVERIKFSLRLDPGCPTI